MKNITIITLAAACLALTVNAQAAGPKEKALEKRVNEVIQSSWADASPEQMARLQQDDTQRQCSEYQNRPPGQLANEIQARERATIQYPEGGIKLGNWKEGEKLANSGYGGRVGRIHPDDPKKPNGGNCYACHALDPKQPAAGNLGPSLTAWGKNRPDTERNRVELYDKVFNAHATKACTNMPRFGYQRFLNSEQIGHIMAYLMDPESPVNK
jgi:sulfur-oxidizing protein SoxX